MSAAARALLLIGLLASALAARPASAQTWGGTGVSNTPSVQASMDLNMEVGAVIGAVVSAQITAGDASSHTVTTDKRAMLTPLVAYLGAAAVMETYTFFEAPTGNGRVGWFKAEQVGYGLFGAGESAVFGAALHRAFIRPVLPSPGTPPGVEFVARF
jgi:hypothetical protein